MAIDLTNAGKQLLVGKQTEMIDIEQTGWPRPNIASSPERSRSSRPILDGVTREVVSDAVGAWRLKLHPNETASRVPPAAIRRPIRELDLSSFW